MKVTRSLTAYAAPTCPVATIGNFDGQHRGHQMLLATVVATAAQMGGTPVVVTFDPPPVRILAPHIALKFLTSPEDKLSAFEAAGIQEVVFLPFTAAFAGLSAETFAQDIVSRTLGIRALFVGEHFAFGKGRTGKIEDLRRFGEAYGFAVHPVVPLMLEGGVVSSTRIRTLLLNGEIEAATRCLGRQYVLRGLVVKGRQRGRELGWPTANLQLPPERVIPADGVYATRTRWQGRTLDSVVYVGSRPTFETVGERLIEVYVLDEQPSLYGEEISIEFVSRVRGDVAFASAEALATQIAADVTDARTRLRAEPCHPQPR